MKKRHNGMWSRLERLETLVSALSDLVDPDVIRRAIAAGNARLGMERVEVEVAEGRLQVATSVRPETAVVRFSQWRRRRFLGPKCITAAVVADFTRLDDRARAAMVGHGVGEAIHFKGDPVHIVLDAAWNRVGEVAAP